MNREKLTFAANIPTIIELDDAGNLQPSTSGADEYRYFLQHDRITWVPPAVHQQIIASGADYPNATFRVVKHQQKARGPITWEVARVDGPNERLGYSNAPTPTTPPRPQPYDSAHTERTPNGQWYDRAAAAPPQRSQPQPAAQLAAEAPELPITAADRMAAALRDAIDLTRGAATYEPAIAWTSADVRAIAATLFIDGGRK
jgi:hypothetical protein